MNVAIRKKTIRAILESLMKGVSILKACDDAGTSTMSFWRWRQKYDVLDKAVERIYESRIMIVEDSLFMKAVGGNVTAQIFFLCNRKPERWHTVNKIEMEHLIKKLPDIEFVPSRGRDAKGS